MMSPEIEAARSELIEQLMLTDPSQDVSFDRIVRLLRSITGSDAAAFTVLDGGRQFLKAREGFTVSETPRDISFCTPAIEQTEMMVVPNAHEDARFANNPLVTGPDGFGFYAGMPVRAPSGLPVGALCILDHKPRELQPAQRAALEDLRGALEEALMLRAMAVLDPMTGLFNRRYFEDVVSREWSRGFAAQVPLAVVVIDVDHFKAYNDHYGHAAGDECLRRVAIALRDGARRVGDVVARIGGEEFMLILPKVDADIAQALLQRIYTTLEQLKLPHEKSPLGRVSVSMGLASVASTAGETLPVALARADRALYEAKSAGRNRIAVALPPG